ncbi:hypothetical protein [Donghicola tyrosinivorans]|uniref:Uncharacterized protein n=1 Tax=Donghicola tyrosinivorans TaxID=1652492 RepID=A0A2T0WA38_9RHOB|nr:hypothetical protein [Donghicola tyrosinivorans]PRY83563.1 hypothetical protein CLV74_13014 [Donghicola tyrosinivorans]
MHIQTNSTQLFKLCGSSGILTAMVASFCAAGFAISLYAGITVSSRVFLASCIIVVFGVATCWVLFQKTEITLNRASDTVTVSKRMLHGTDSFDMPLSQVAQADVDIQRKQAKGQAYRLVLVTDSPTGAERLVIGHGFSEGPNSVTTARMINRWLGVPEAQIGAAPFREDLRAAHLIDLKPHG